MPASKIFAIEFENNNIIVNIECDSSIDADLNILSEVKQLIEHIQKTTPDRVVFDFSHAAYFGSSMLEAILEVWNLIKDSECKMVICELSDIGEEIFQLSKLDTLWTIKPTRKEAIELN